MKKSLKSAALLTLALLMLATGVYVPFRTAEAAMMYNNTLSTSVYCSVDSAGTLSAVLNVTGKKGTTTRIETELYVEKKTLGVFWTRVDIGYTNNLWIDSTTNYKYNNTFSTSLDSTGTYRVTVKFTVYGTGGIPDEITQTKTIVY